MEDRLIKNFYKTFFKIEIREQIYKLKNYEAKTYAKNEHDKT